MLVLNLTIVLILILKNVVNINSQSEFVTIFAPKFVRQNESMTVFYTTNKAVAAPLDITFGYRWWGFTQEIDNDSKMKEIKFDNKTTIESNKLKIKVILSGTKNGVKKCLEKELEVKVDKNIHNVFIQLDKPVYKPGDKVQFRVIVLDNNLKLFHINNLKIEIVDPLNKRYKVTDDLTDRILSIINEKFLLADEVVFGDWKVEVTIDKNDKSIVSKSFAVQKYVLPPFEVFVKTNKKHYTKNNAVEISFYGRYSFEEYVMKGKAHMKITRKTEFSTDLILSKSDLSVSEIYTMKWNDNNFPIGISKAEYEVFVSIKEPQSGHESNSTTNFIIHEEQIFKIIPEHPKNFQPGLPFLMKIFVYDWKDDPVVLNSDDIKIHFVKINVILTKTQDEKLLIIHNKEVINGIASYDEDIDENVTNIQFEISFINSEIYRAEIKKGIDIMIRGFTISHSPERPMFGQNVDISVKSDIDIDKLLVIYSTHNGNMEKDTIACNNVKICKFITEIDGKKVPSFTVSVFQIVNRNRIISGKTTVETKSLGENELTFEVPKKAEPFKRSEVKFNSKKNSRVYVLAFDKRLTYLGKGNDVTSSDIRKAYENYNGENNYLVMDLNIDDSWPTCSLDQEKKINAGKKKGTKQSSSSDSAVFVDDSYKESKNENSKSEQNGEKTNIDKVRENFPETWIFESFEIEGGKTKNFQVKIPHSITTWMMSAFAVDHDTAIAIANPKELTVKIDFFIKLNLPYSIKYKEVLQVDILVYNYVQFSDRLTVDVTLENLNKNHPDTKELIKEFEFVKINDNKCTFNTDDVESKPVVVKKGMVKKVSFHIRSNPQDSENSISRKILLQVRATARDSNAKIYKDAVKRSLLVEQVGIIEQDIQTQIVKLNGANSKIYTFKEQHPNAFYPKTLVFIRGDRLSEKMNLDVDKSSNVFFPEGCAGQRTSKMKGAVEYYRYLKMKNLNTSFAMSQINLYYSKLTETGSTSKLAYWSYSESSSYVAFFTDIFVSAMEVGAFDFNDHNQKFIEQDFDKLVDFQSSSGAFECNECIYPTFPRGRQPSENFFDTAYALIPFLKYKKLCNNQGYQFEDSYQIAINLGISYLSGPDKDRIEHDARAIVAYAYALNNDTQNANHHLDKIKKVKIIYSGNKACYRRNLVTSSCDFEMTVFVALAYITLDKIPNAEPIIDYILEHHYQNMYYSNTYQTAIATEAIAKIAGKIRNVNTNIDMKMSNEHIFLKDIPMTNSQSTKYHEISLPEYSKIVHFSLSGYGYCSLTTVFLKRQIVARSTSIFDVVVTPNATKHEVQVCTKYIKPNLNPDEQETLVNVIYEIETPSGYTYDSVINLVSHSAYLRKIEERKKKTLVFLYFDQFHENQNYCVSLNLTKNYDVKNVAAAGVKVYDYEGKDNFASEFYNMDRNGC